MTFLEKSRGAFIVLEGCDRSGKSTQVKLLVNRLEQLGHNVMLWKFPERKTQIGSMIDEYLKNVKDVDDKAIHLLFSANRWECMSEMKKKLLDGITLVVDRYAYSGAAYSAAKGLDLEWCKSPDIGLLTPDIVFFMNLTSEEAEKRFGFGNERYEEKAFQEKVRNIFNFLKDPTWKVLNACRAVEKLHKEIERLSLKTIQKCSNLPLKEDLWEKCF
ncbi:thymidylate kinase-domain-containing protein [Gigaspora rosea]|uniref:Thymidylate kinase n=1 Tax=Gigaspora rosea TaxID=44941 RepID=A0A397UCW7_9GLOM|nr:thymidylate kinase-domain-containing protein [Gigaspora rosea]